MHQHSFIFYVGKDFRPPLAGWGKPVPLPEMTLLLGPKNNARNGRSNQDAAALRHDERGRYCGMA